MSAGPWIVVLAAIGGLGYVLWANYARRPTIAVPRVNDGTGPSGLGGWLILIMVGQLKVILIGLWTVMTCAVGIATKPQFALALTAELLLTAPVLALGAWTTVEMFRKKRTFPAIWKVQAAAQIAYALLDCLLVSALLNVPIQSVLDEMTMAEFAVLVVGLTLWWCYMNVSIRVKNTFVN